MIEDAELLRRYAADHSEDAFAELVQRHLGLVYSVALRQVEGHADLAQDVTQKVFADLARKAAPLSRHPVLTGWLYRVTQFTAIDVMRSERRRRMREHEAITMQELSTPPGPDIDGEKLRPVLDQVMGELNDRDRDAVMLRFFEERPFAEVGTKLSLTEDAARMRVERSLEKMRALLARRGVTSTTAALAVVLAGQAGVAAPLGLATSISGGALAGAGVATATVTFMTMSKLQVALVGALLVAGGTGLVIEQRANADRLKQEIEQRAAQTRDLAKLREENQRLTGVAAEARGYQDGLAAAAKPQNETGDLAAHPRMRAALNLEDAPEKSQAPRVQLAAMTSTVPENPQPIPDPIAPLTLAVKENGIVWNSDLVSLNEFILRLQRYHNEQPDGRILVTDETTNTTLIPNYIYNDQRGTFEVDGFTTKAIGSSLFGTAVDEVRKAGFKNVSIQTNPANRFDQGPAPIFQPSTIYPDDSKGLGGNVTVELIVDRHGDVTDALAVASNRRELEAVAVESVKKWKFSPAVKDGQPVTSRIRTEIIFSPGEGDKTTPAGQPVVTTGTDKSAAPPGPDAFPYPNPAVAPIPVGASMTTPATPGSGLGQIFNLSQLDQIPVATAQAKPMYPSEMRRAGITGEVSVEFYVDKTGTVHEAFAVDSSRQEFEAAAVKAVSQWRFKPGKKGGAAVTTRMRTTIVFKL